MYDLSCSISGEGLYYNMFITSVDPGIVLKSYLLFQPCYHDHIHTLPHIHYTYIPHYYIHNHTHYISTIHTTTGKLRAILDYDDLKPEVFQNFREIGNSIALLSDLSDILELHDQFDFVLIAPFLGVAPTGGMCCDVVWWRVIMQ